MVDSVDLFPLAIFLMTKYSLVTKEEHEAMEKFNARINDVVYEHQTGMPAISRWMPSADKM